MMTVNDMERIWEDMVVAYFKALICNLPGETKANHAKSVRTASLQSEI